MTKMITSRRRFLSIIAATSAVAAAPGMLRQTVAATDVPAVSWRGVALGADAELHIYHPDRAFAENLVRLSLTEARRLEKVFSLYQNDSALVRLNRDSRLVDAPTDLLRLLQTSHRISDMTNGVFDPTVQALWQLHADAIRAGTGTPSAAEVAAALQRVDYRAVRIDGRNIHFDRPGMMLTLNGIAQGYITDRVTELLRDAGLDHALVDMGEIRGLIRDESARAFRVGLAGDSDERRPLQVLEVRNQAVSTSTGRATVLDAEGRITHLFNPRTGSAVPRYRSVSTVAGDATTADACSTAFSMMDETDIARVASSLRAEVWVLREGSEALSRIG